ncbi:MAG: DNA processing protein DprA [marine bacterium B5-7]|nr:MAG: DNA processing protein DprA [marine bacterium B5-7]
MNRQTLTAWLILSRCPGIGAIKFQAIQSLWPNLSDCLAASSKQLRQQGFTTSNVDFIKTKKHPWLDAIWPWLDNENNHLITLEDASYPSLLKTIPDPPPVLFIRGNVSLLQKTQLAIVGARQATPGGCNIAMRLSEDMVKNNIVITSGLAHGIDGSAHRGALQGNGRTIAVLGTDIQTIYPKQHVNLAQTILDNNGTIISETHQEMSPHPSSFPKRNRIISGLSRGTLVVEAAMRSGSLITARLANEQNRDVFAMPGSIFNLKSRGCHHLIKQGAALVESAEDILSAWEISHASTSPRKTRKKSPLIQHIGVEPTSFDQICSFSQLTPPEVSAKLVELEMEGFICKTVGGYQRQE